MSDNPLKLAVIVGSVREGRFAPAVAKWFVGQAEQRDDVEIDLIDLADIPLGTAGPTMNPAPETLNSLKQLTPRLHAADGFVVVTAEYNHSYPASLKAAIDWHNEQFHAKPVAFVSYGGMAGGLRAVEHLRVVFAELHAVTTRNTISFHNIPEQFGPDGVLTNPEGPNTAAKKLLDQVTWWARVLRDAKAKTPYGA